MGMPDNVEHPEHYRHGGHECIDAIRSMLSEEEWKGYVKGNVLKYMWRESSKGGIEDLSKARWYLDNFDKI